MNVKLCSHSLMIACFWLLPLSAAQVHAQVQQYPSKSVTIISDSAAGSTPDAVLRVIADRLSQSWGQQVLAVNHPGAAGSIASRIAADSPPDGYTLYMRVRASSRPGWVWCHDRIPPAANLAWAGYPSAATNICAGF